MANLVSCALSLFPATGNFGCTVLANDVGVRTPAANAFVGLFITVLLTQLTPILYYIPRATLGAVIANAMVALLDWPEFIKAFWIAPAYFLIMSATFCVTALVDVALGLQVGLALSITVLLFQLSRVERQAMGRLHEQVFVPLDRYPGAVERPGIKCYKLTGYLWFGNASKVRCAARCCAEGGAEGEVRARRGRPSITSRGRVSFFLPILFLMPIPHSPHDDRRSHGLSHPLPLSSL